MSKIEGEEEHHESYGIVSFNRLGCSGKQNLYGSSISHSQTIALRIGTSYKRRSFSKDRYCLDKGIIEVEMSSAQFAELITSMNMGEGIPCTIKRNGGKMIEECPEEDTHQRLEDDFEEQIKQLNDKVTTLTKSVDEIITSKGTVTKGKKDELQSAAQQLRQEVNSNIPFIRKLYTESITKTVTEAKAEIEAFAMNRRLGDVVELPEGHQKILEEGK